MGKTKNKKRKSRNYNPTGLPSVKEFEEDEENMGAVNRFDGKHGTVQSLLEKLQSGSVESKECAACTIAIFAAQSEARPELLGNDVVKIAAPLLMDASPLVRVSVAGALRNLSACGGHEVCELMIEHDVLTPLVALLRTYEEGWASETTSLASKRLNSKSQIFVEATNLLWNLCESSQTAVSVFNRENLLPIFANCLSIANHGIEVTTAVAHCLHTVTEDNPEVCSQLSEAHVLEHLTSVITLDGDENSHHLLRTLAVGIFQNIHCGKVTASGVASSLNSLFFALSQALDKSPLTLILTFCDLLERRKKDDLQKEKKMPDIESLDEQVQISTKEIESLLEAKQIALETITNMCCGDDAGEDWEDMSSSDTSEEIMDVPMDEETPFGKPNPLDIPCDIHEAIVSLGLVEKIQQHIQLPSETKEKLQRHLKGKEILKKMKTVQCRALLCINNLAVSLDVEDFGGPLQLYKLWLQLAELAFKETDPKDIEVLEASTSAVRGTLQRLAEIRAWDSFQETSEADLKLLFDMAQQCPDANIRANIVRIAGTLGLMLVNSSPTRTHVLAKNIGQFLLEIGNKDTEVWVAAEALDTIFDFFSEDNLDSVAHEISLVEKLKHIMPMFKSKIQQQRKAGGEHHPVVMTVKTNLPRFIKYKAQHSHNGTIK